MIDRIISEYINKLTPMDIKKYALQENIVLTDKEINILYNYALNDWYTILHSDPTTIFNDLKENLSSDAYNKLMNLYKENMEKYKAYL